MRGSTKEKIEIIEELVADESYDIRPDGTIWRSLKSGKWVQTGKAITKGYRHLKYHGVDIRLHRAVYAKYVGKLDPALVVDHKDGNTLNNLPSNLQQITDVKNVQKGVHTKLNEEMVREIFNLKAEGWVQRRIAEKFGVQPSSISMILNNKQWKGFNDGKN